jgi:hypothetical protein
MLRRLFARLHGHFCKVVVITFHVGFFGNGWSYHFGLTLVSGEGTMVSG